MKRLFIALMVFTGLSLFGGEKLFTYRSFNPEFEAMKDFAKAGVNTIAFLPGNTANSLGDQYSRYPNNWICTKTFCI